MAAPVTPSFTPAGPAESARRPEVDVLIVDDRPEQLLALEAVLTDLDVVVHKAASGREALQFMLRRDFALILLDVNMPGMDGFELAAMIRERPRSSRTPIIFVTAASEVDTHVSRGYSLGAVDYIHVPVVSDILRAKVNVFVELHRKTEEIRRVAEERRALEAREHQRQLDHAMESLAAEARQVEMLREEQRRAAAAQRLASATLALNAAESIDHVLEAIAERSRELVGASCAYAWVRDDGAPRVAASGAPIPDVTSPGHSVAGDTAHLALLAAAAELEASARLTDRALDHHPVLAGELGRVPARERPSHWLSVPLAGRDRRLGVCVLWRGADDPPFDVADEEAMTSLARTASMALRDLLFREAREANRLKDEFLAVLSHELRTPLSAMLGWTQLLRTGKLDERNGERAIEIIERNLKIQTQLIDELLDMSRIVNGKLRIDPTPLLLPPVVSGAVDALRPAAVAKEIRLDAEIEAQSLCIWGDAGRLEQVVWNLVSNAIKFTPRGGSIHVRLRRLGTAAEIRVEDDGEGIDATLLPLIFDRFTQAESSVSRAHGGLGLGLTIVRRLVEMHGGTILAQSAGKGLGACFTVRLPVFDADVAGLMAASRGQAGPSLTDVHVLVVDDESDVRDMVAAALRDAGARVTSAASAVAAMDAVNRDPPDVLVSDISMPEEDGYAFMRRLRQRPADQGGLLPAIALTALTEHRHHVASLEAGFQIHLGKPIDLKHLVLAAAALAPAGMRARGGLPPAPPLRWF
jgi:signal transduction histidine kinase/DNA-binding response OmpR family regulator